MQRRFAWKERAMLAVAAVLAGATIAAAIRAHSWQPIEMMAWLPAVVVATLGPRDRTGRCVARLRRRFRS